MSKDAAGLDRNARGVSSVSVHPGAISWIFMASWKCRPGGAPRKATEPNQGPHPPISRAGTEVRGKVGAPGSRRIRNTRRTLLAGWRKFPSPQAIWGARVAEKYGETMIGQRSSVSSRAHRDRPTDRKGVYQSPMAHGGSSHRSTGLPHSSLVQGGSPCRAAPTPAETPLGHSPGTRGGARHQIK
jgi:hypothetical protein